jgi:hypothetical protein
MSEMATKTLEFRLPDLSPEEARGLVRRLLANVPEEPPRRVSAPGRPRPREDAYEPAFEKSLAAVERAAQDLARERAAAAGLWADFRKEAHDRRRLRVRNDRRHQTWGFCERLLAESGEAARHAPRRALEIADLALEAVRRLDAGRYGADRIADLEARAWGAVAEGRRLRSDLDGARYALDCARQALERGTGDPLEKASVAALEAALAVDLGDYAGAAESLDRAMRIHRRLGDPHFAGDALVQEALAEHPEAVEALSWRARRSG